MQKFLTGVAVLTLAACSTTSAVVTPIAQLKASSDVTVSSLLALNAICGAEASKGGTANLKLTAGMGTGGFKVDTTSKEAQDWFNYSMALSHAFYHEDAKAAMRKALELDPGCSMCAWGLAWVLGPTLNYGITDTERRYALAAAENAKSLLKAGDERGRRLVEAMIARYAPTNVPSEQSGERTATGHSVTEPAFGQALAAIAADYPDEVELAVLAAHSLLIPVRGGNASGLKPALAILEQVLKDRPNDTGAIHYYIHATEFDKRAEDAVSYADRLGGLAPAASHLVHMPAHTFFHAGRYHDAAVVNAEAIGADLKWSEAGGDFEAPFMPMYYAHNLAFGLAGALMSGDAQLSLKYASHADLKYKSLTTSPAAYPLPRTWVALARYAPQEAIAATTLQGADARFGIYHHYARGEAFLQLGDLTSARAELQALKNVKGTSKYAEHLVAQGVLGGRIAMAENNPTKAATLFESAAKIQETQLADSWDPPAWWYPVRRSVAAAYLKAGDFARARLEAGRSLAAWEADPMALWVKGKAQAGAGQARESETTLDEARKLWFGDFSSITIDTI